MSRIKKRKQSHREKLESNQLGKNIAEGNIIFCLDKSLGKTDFRGKFCRLNVLINIYKSFTRPHLDFANIIYDQLTNGPMTIIWKVFNTILH